MKTDPNTTTETPETYSEQAESVQNTEQDIPMFGFFAIGMFINVVIVAAFFYWAYKQWGRSGKRDDRNE